MIRLVSIDFWKAELFDLPIIDVRSPVEFSRGHIPGSVNIPLFSDEERVLVSTAYKQVSQEKAVELGYQYANPKLEYFLSRSLGVAPKKEVVVHCWRGGMRSSAFAAHLEANGFRKVYRIENGYKAYRNYIHAFFEKPFLLKVLGGYSGSGKTGILHCLADLGQQVVDLEGLANHRGSAFGGIEMPDQPSAEQFENILFTAMQALDPLKPIWIEDESNAIGRVNIPKTLFLQMNRQMVYFLNIPRDKRAKHLVDIYAGLKKENLAQSIGKLSKRLGPDQTKLALQELDKGNYYQVAGIMLYYYDKYYLKGIQKRDKTTVLEVELSSVNHPENAGYLIRLP